MTYKESHPWITFEANNRKLTPHFWMCLGEAKSKCEHLAGVPLKPHFAQTLNAVYLAKGIHATTAIEGNTLSEQQVHDRLEATEYSSEDYKELEVDNVIKAVGKIENKLATTGPSPITIEEISAYNEQVLIGTDFEKSVIPGQFRNYPVGVADYRGVDHIECGPLMQNLCDWLNGRDFNGENDHSVEVGIMKAIIAHIYLVWIHPFGDGNGRTARLLEVKFLMEAGVPSCAIHLLSNHYNKTRPTYFRKLSEISRNGGDLSPFFQYAIDGLASELRDQINIIKTQQWDIAWESYVYECFEDRKTEVDRRRMRVVFALGQQPPASFYPIKGIPDLTPGLARRYAGKTQKTLNRDVNKLIEKGFLEKRGSMVRARKELILAFLPRTTPEVLKNQIITDVQVRGFDDDDRDSNQLDLLDLLEE